MDGVPLLEHALERLVNERASPQSLRWARRKGEAFGPLASHRAGVHDVHTRSGSRGTAVSILLGNPRRRPTGWGGVSSKPIPKELRKHNLEDGGVVVNYRPDSAARVAEHLEVDRGARYPERVFLAPFPSPDRHIALTA